MKRILVYGMTDNLGGMEAYIRNIYQHLDKEKIQFDFICDFPSMTFSDFYLKNDCKIHYIPPKNKGLFRSLWEMYKVIKKGNYDTVYFNIMNAGYVLNMLPAFLLGKKIVAHSHNADTTKKRLHYLLRWLLNLISSKRLACTDAAANFMFGTSKNYTIIKNGIMLSDYSYSLEKYKHIRKELEIGIDSKVIIYVARMDEQKNPFFTLDVIKEINKIDNNILLLYVGDGPLHDEVINYINVNNIKNVKILGIRNDVNKLMITSDILILPSLFEGLGIVAIEAQAAGLPVLLSNTIPQDAKILDSTEFLPIGRDNTLIWVDKIIKILRKRERYSNIALLQKAGYDITLVSKELQKILLD